MENVIGVYKNILILTGRSEVVSRSVWDREIASSILAAPTIFKSGCGLRGSHHLKSDESMC